MGSTVDLDWKEGKDSCFLLLPKEAEQPLCTVLDHHGTDICFYSQSKKVEQSRSPHGHITPRVLPTPSKWRAGLLVIAQLPSAPNPSLSSQLAPAVNPVATAQLQPPLYNPHSSVLAQISPFPHPPPCNLFTSHKEARNALICLSLKR